MQTPTWMPPMPDGNTHTKVDTVGGSGELTMDTFLRQVNKAAQHDWVQRGKNWKTRMRRRILRGCWRLLRRLLRKAGARRVALAPWYLCALTYFTSAVMSLIDRGWLTLLAAATLGAPVAYWWLGAPAWFITRRRNLPSRVRRLWYVAAYVTMTVLAVLTAAWRTGVPMPGLWFTAALTFSIATAWGRRRRPAKSTVVHDERHQLWNDTGKVEGAELGPITDLQEPRRWAALADLSGTDMLVEDLVKKTAYIAKRYKVPRNNVVIDEAVPGEDALALLTVILENPLHRPVDFDESWLNCPEEGCFDFHVFPDGARGRLRLYTPGSGTVNALFSGDIGSGKSAGMFAAAIQAIMTGRVYPIVGDPQQGQSLPALAGPAGIAPMKATDVPGVYNQLQKIYAGMLARSDYLQSYRWRDKYGDLRVGMDFFDQDIMREQVYNEDTGEHPLYWPIILYILEEVHLACKDPEFGALIVELLEMIIKLSRKTGIAVWVATQYPGIEELGNKMAIRQNLVAGNVICYRNSATTAGTMVLPSNLPAPHTIPKETPDGNQTQGMAVISSAAPRSSRATFPRSVFIDRKGWWADQAAKRIHPLDDVTEAAMDKVDLDQQDRAAAELVAAHQAAKAGSTTPAAAVPAGKPWKDRSQGVLYRCLAYLRHIEETTGHGETTAGVLAFECGAELSAVSTALKRASEPTKKRPAILVHSPRTGTWALGEKPAQELVGAAA